MDYASRMTEAIQPQGQARRRQQAAPGWGDAPPDAAPMAEVTMADVAVNRATLEAQAALMGLTLVSKGAAESVTGMITGATAVARFEKRNGTPEEGAVIMSKEQLNSAATDWARDNNVPVTPKPVRLYKAMFSGLFALKNRVVPIWRKTTKEGGIKYPIRFNGEDEASHIDCGDYHLAVMVSIFIPKGEKVVTAHVQMIKVESVAPTRGRSGSRSGSRGRCRSGSRGRGRKGD